MVVTKTHGCYSDPSVDSENEEHAWGFGMGELVNALIRAGLQIEYLHEFPHVGYKRFPYLVQGEDERWRWKEPSNTIPLTFSIRAKKSL